jgi:SHS2 domain-containing protein
MHFELLEHPADIGFRAHGGSLPDLFANAALAMLSIAAELDNVRPVESFELAAEGSDYESLLVNWLNEVLYRFDGERIAFCEFRIHHLDTAAVRATALGEPRDPTRQRPKLIVKAVTYHQIKVARDGEGWLAEVYLDV